MFKKPQKKNLRQRLEDENEVVDVGDDEPMEEDSISEAAAMTVKREKKKKKQQREAEIVRPKAVLSFEEDLDEDGEVFQVRKSSQSKKLARQLDRERRRRRQLDQLQQQQPSNGQQVVPPPPTEAPAAIPDPPAPPKAEPAAPLILSGRDAEFAVLRSDSEDEETEGACPKFSRPRQLQHVLKSGCIPDAAMIHAARKSRQRAREMGDFIPVEEKSTDPSSNSRLIREDEEDHDVSDDEHGENGGVGGGESKRLDFTVDTTAKEQERRREAFIAAQEQEPSEVHSDLDDDEVENWEAQQIRKAVTGAQLASAQQELIQQQGIIGHQALMQPPQPPTLCLTEGPGPEQVLQQMLAKAEAHTPDELARLLRDRSANGPNRRGANLGDGAPKTSSNAHLKFSFVPHQNKVPTARTFLWICIGANYWHFYDLKGFT